jgi:hypothetical protein
MGLRTTFDAFRSFEGAGFPDMGGAQRREAHKKARRDHRG